LILLAVLLLLNNFPARAFPFDPYRDAGVAPYQALIRYVAAGGGLTFWSLPEARDLHVLSRGPFRVTVRTEPYPEDLLATDGYTGFGGIYEDTTTFTDPGGGWDRRLQEFALKRGSADLRRRLQKLNPTTDPHYDRLFHELIATDGELRRLKERQGGPV
jgi:hypothetical protein